MDKVEREKATLFLEESCPPVKEENPKAETSVEDAVKAARTVTAENLIVYFQICCGI